MVAEGKIENVASLYNEAEVLLTGATGFLAGVLLEKLLHENVKKIYVLVRERGGKSPEERMQKVLSSPVSLVISIYNNILADSDKII